MKLFKKRKVIALLVVLFFGVELCPSVYAADNTRVYQPEPPLYACDLLWNIESIYYYVDSSASALAKPIANAANNWVYTGHGWNNLYPNTRTYNITNSAIDIYGYKGYDGNYGKTLFFARTNGTSGSAYEVKNPNSQNWLYNKVNLYTTELTKTGKEKTAQGVVAHEMGHCFGLGENNENQNSIMCQTASGRQVYTIQLVDQNAFNKKHP